MSAIGVGDLVMMVRRICDCPKCTHPINIPFVVSEIVGTAEISIWCTTHHRVVGHAPVAQGFSGYNIPVSALKKIEPPALDEDETERQELTA